MSLSMKDVEKIAHLARIQLSDTELSQFQPEISNILQMVAAMDKIDTSAVEPMAHPLDTTQRLRDDKVTEVDQHELFQSLAPSTEQDLYLVPQVIEQGDS